MFTVRWEHGLENLHSYLLLELRERGVFQMIKKRLLIIGIVLFIVGTTTTRNFAKEHGQITIKPNTNAPNLTPRYPAPDFTLPDQFGTPFSLSDQRGSVVAMMFWTSW